MLARVESYLERFAALHPRKIDLSLGRIERLLAKLGDPQKRLPPVIHVAGTNGKGSTIAFMRACLEAEGRRVHVYTSPHLVRFNERIRLSGELVDDARLAEALSLIDAVNNGETITFFEATTAAAFALFSETPADALLLEVGLGGRYDATNVIEAPAATVIAPVSLDHVEWFGSTIPEIAYEKAGILRAGAPAIIGDQSPEGLAVIEREAARLDAPRFVSGRDFHVSFENGRLVYEDEAGLLDLPPPRLPGRHQFGNAGLAVATLRRLWPEIPASALDRGLRSAEWPARLQRLRLGPLTRLGPKPAEIWLDGAHNEDGGRALAEAMADFEDAAPAPLVLIAASLASKDTRGFLAHFRGLAQEALCVPLSGEHAGRSAEEVAAIARAVGLPAAASDSVASALEFFAARSWPSPPRILIIGSLYLAGDVLKANDEAPH